MTDIKHTPLPLKVMGRSDGSAIYLVRNNVKIAKVKNLDDAFFIERAYNAHYVLVEALEHALEYFKKDGQRIEFNKMIEEMRAALWMARGE